MPDLVQGWDRYAYVNNNPIAYTDPSGHRLCGDGEDINCDGTTNTTTPPIDLGTQADPSQPDTLDLPGQPDDLVAIYLRYRYMWYQPHDSWWWKRYGRGGFTFWEFMSIFFGYEQNVYPTAQDFATTMGNRAPAICSAINCNPHSVEGALRFVATLESARRRMTCLATGACNFEEAFGEPPIPSGQGSLSILEAIYMSAKILPGRHEMYNLGNESMQPNIYRKMISLGFVYSVYGLRGQNRMVILTFCQQLMVDYAVFNGGAKVINGRTYRDFCGE